LLTIFKQKTPVCLMLTSIWLIMLILLNPLSYCKDIAFLKSIWLLETPKIVSK